MTLPLEGYRVLDWTVWQQGPVASAMLGDLGAEVIKIESRTGGDPLRGLLGTVGGAKQTAGVIAERNFYFEHCNCNKKSIALDLTKEKGREIIYKLAEKSDVLVQNFRKDVAARLGLDYATLSRYNPRLVYATASGWGSKGPDRNRPALDFMGVARSGIMTIPGEPDQPPLQFQANIADQIGAIMTAHGVVIALLMRERHGMGQEVEASMLGSMICLLSTLVDFKLLSGVEQPKWSRVRPRNPLWNHYRCKDDKWVALGLLQPDRYWPTLCQALGIKHLEKDRRFENMDARAENAAEMVSVLDSVFATKTRQEWLDILSNAGDLLFEPVNTISDLVKDTQVWDNDYIIEYQHPVWGKVPMVGFPVRFSDATTSVRLPPPEFGQHTEEVLRDILGYSWRDISDLKDAEVI
jgi:CoA:oxalate CoA-transferase